MHPCGLSAPDTAPTCLSPYPLVSRPPASLDGTRPQAMRQEWPGSRSPEIWTIAIVSHVHWLLSGFRLPQEPLPVPLDLLVRSWGKLYAPAVWIAGKN